LKLGGAKLLILIVSGIQTFSQTSIGQRGCGLLAINNFRSKTASIGGGKVTEKQWWLVRNHLLRQICWKVSLIL
jgi:hypothetical protein